MTSTTKKQRIPSTEAQMAEAVGRAYREWYTANDKTTVVVPFMHAWIHARASELLKDIRGDKE